MTYDEMYRLTPEDAAIMRKMGLGTRSADRADAALMAELGRCQRETGYKATATPISLATIGLPWQSVQDVARSLHGYRVNPVSFAERIELQRYVTLEARSEAVDKAGQNGRAWEC